MILQGFGEIGDVIWNNWIGDNGGLHANPGTTPGRGARAKGVAKY
jgi:hypothetical protein